MTAHHTAFDYRLLWDVIDHSPQELHIMTQKLAEVWPGYPKNLVQPNPIHTDTSLFIKDVRSVAPIGGRYTKRGRGYASLSNYNFIP